jgi:hypothetical protein
MLASNTVVKNDLYYENNFIIDKSTGNKYEVMLDVFSEEIQTNIINKLKSGEFTLIDFITSGVTPDIKIEVQIDNELFELVFYKMLDSTNPISENSIKNPDLEYENNIITE